MVISNVMGPKQQKKRVSDHFFHHFLVVMGILLGLFALFPRSRVQSGRGGKFRKKIVTKKRSQWPKTHLYHPVWAGNRIFELFQAHFRLCWAPKKCENMPFWACPRGVDFDPSEVGLLLLTTRSFLTGGRGSPRGSKKNIFRHSGVQHTEKKNKKIDQKKLFWGHFFSKNFFLKNTRRSACKSARVFYLEMKTTHFLTQTTKTRGNRFQNRSVFYFIYSDPNCGVQEDSFCLNLLNKEIIRTHD